MFYSNFLRPFLQSLYIVIDRLLLGDLPIEESETIRNWCQFCATPAYYTPFPLMLEAVNSDSFRNSLLLLRQKGVLSEDSKCLQRHEGEVMHATLMRLLTVEQYTRTGSICWFGSVDV